MNGNGWIAVYTGTCKLKNILLAIEDCKATTIASPLVERAMELASAFSSKVWLVHVVPPSREAPYNVDTRLSRDEAAAELHHEHRETVHAE